MVKLIDDSAKSSVIAKKPSLSTDVDWDQASKEWEKKLDFAPPKAKKSKDLPDHITRILCIMWLNSHTRARKQKQYSTENETFTILTKWLEEHPV
jgi:hypothetical protein